jgi:WKF domain
MAADFSDTNGSSVSNTTPQRIPAWKKLGLKLKFAKENADQPQQLQSPRPTNKKRSLAKGSQEKSEISIVEPSQKRPRLDSSEPSPKNSLGADVKVLSPSLRRSSSGIKKSVSFTSETKLEDGDSSKSLIAGWEAQFDQPSIHPIQVEETQQKKEKRPKQKKSKPVSSQNKPNTALEYLTQFRDSRDTWKFKKTRETWILKHLFSVNNIPSDYDIALSDYLQGLKSSVARARIRKEAEDIVQKDLEQPLEYNNPTTNHDDSNKAERDQDDMEDPNRRRAYYEDSVKRYKRKLEQHLDKVDEEELKWISPERLAKRRRAEIMLWAINVTPPVSENAQSTDRSFFRESARADKNTAVRNGILPNNAPKKRKNRTSVIEISSSSESENSTDSSSESDDHEAAAQRPRSSGSSTGTTETSSDSKTVQQSETDSEEQTDTSTDESSDESETSDVSPPADTRANNGPVTNNRPNNGAVNGQPKSSSNDSDADSDESSDKSSNGSVSDDEAPPANVHPPPIAATRGLLHAVNGVQGGVSGSSSEETSDDSDSGNGTLPANSLRPLPPTNRRQPLVPRHRPAMGVNGQPSESSSSSDFSSDESEPGSRRPPTTNLQQTHVTNSRSRPSASRRQPSIISISS